MNDELDRVGKRTKMRDDLYISLCKAAGNDRDRLGLDFDGVLFDVANRLTATIWNELQIEIEKRKIALGFGGTWGVVK